MLGVHREVWVCEDTNRRWNSAPFWQYRIMWQENSLKVWALTRLGFTKFHAPRLCLARWNVETPEFGKQPMRQSQEARWWTADSAHAIAVEKENLNPLLAVKMNFPGGTWIVLFKREFPIKSFLENIYCNEQRLRISTFICCLWTMTHMHTLQKLTLSCSGLPSISAK